MPVPPAASSSGTRPASGGTPKLPNGPSIAIATPVSADGSPSGSPNAPSAPTSNSIVPRAPAEGGEATEYAARVLSPWRPAITACPARNANGPSSSSWTSRVRGVVRRTDLTVGDHGRRSSGRVAPTTAI